MQSRPDARDVEMLPVADLRFAGRLVSGDGFSHAHLLPVVRQFLAAIEAGDVRAVPHGGSRKASIFAYGGQWKSGSVV